MRPKKILTLLVIVAVLGLTLWYFVPAELQLQLGIFSSIVLWLLLAKFIVYWLDWPRHGLLSIKPDAISIDWNNEKIDVQENMIFHRANLKTVRISLMGQEPYLGPIWSSIGGIGLLGGRTSRPYPKFMIWFEGQDAQKWFYGLVQGRKVQSLVDSLHANNYPLLENIKEDTRYYKSYTNVVFVIYGIIILLTLMNIVSYVNFFD